MPGRKRPHAIHRVGAAGAALLLAAWFGGHHTIAPPRLQVTVTDDQSAAPRPDPDPDQHARARSPIWITVQADRPACVRILALDQAGQVTLLPIDSAGGYELRLDADVLATISGLQTGNGGNPQPHPCVTRLLVIATGQSLDTALLSDFLANTPTPTDRDEDNRAAHLARHIRRRFSATVRLVRP